jgi:ubiquinone biosynthesis protein Coq4
MHKYSQCACCEKIFMIVDEEVMYCSTECRNNHDIFKIVKDIKKLPGDKPGKKSTNNTLILP